MWKIFHVSELFGAHICKVVDSANSRGPYGSLTLYLSSFTGPFITRRAT